MNLLIKMALIFQLFACNFAYSNIFFNDPVLKPAKINPGSISVKVKWAIASNEDLASLCPENPLFDSNAGCVVFSNDLCIIYTGAKAITHVVLGERMLACSKK